MITSLAPIAWAAMSAPSSTRYGFSSRIARSLNVPGSPSAALTTTGVGWLGELYGGDGAPLQPGGEAGAAAAAQSRRRRAGRSARRTSPLAPQSSAAPAPAGSAPTAVPVSRRAVSGEGGGGSPGPSEVDADPVVSLITRSCSRPSRAAKRPAVGTWREVERRLGTPNTRL